MSYSQHRAEHLRITILRLLEQEPAYQLNEAMIADLVGPFGFAVGRDLIRTELAWLAEQGLITLEQPAGVSIATLTRRGGDVALGRVTVPGVRRPSPAD